MRQVGLGGLVGPGSLGSFTGETDGPGKSEINVSASIHHESRQQDTITHS